jgi:hypothetical protein
MWYFEGQCEYFEDYDQRSIVILQMFCRAQVILLCVE